jgi:hypothetical protein
MAVAYRSGSHITPAAATSPATGTEPTGTVQDDYMLALFITESGVGGADLSRPTSWVNPDSEPALGYAATGNVFMELAGILRPSSAPSFAFTWAANAPLSRQRELYIGTFSGVNTTTPIQSFGTAVIAGSPSATQPTPPSATYVDGCMAVVFLTHWGGAPAGGWTAPSGYTIGSIDTAGNAGGALAYRALTGSGTESPGPFGGTPASSDYSIVQTIILAPAAGGGASVFPPLQIIRSNIRFGP